MKGNLTVLPASKEAESPSNSFSSVQFSDGEEKGGGVVAKIAN